MAVSKATRESVSAALRLATDQTIASIERWGDGGPRSDTVLAQSNAQMLSRLLDIMEGHGMVSADLRESCMADLYRTMGWV